MAPQACIMKELGGGHAQFLRVCRGLASNAVTEQIDYQKLGLKCFSCGNAATGFGYWNFIYTVTNDTLKWINYGACSCNSDECLKVIDERIRGWVNTGKNKIHNME